jgi:hypothetical protein
VHKLWCATLGLNQRHAAELSATHAAPVDAEIAHADADLAAEVIACGVTMQHVEAVIAVLAANRAGVSINVAAKASGLNYRTAQRIVGATAEHRERSSWWRSADGCHRERSGFVSGCWCTTPGATVCVFGIGVSPSCRWARGRPACRPSLHQNRLKIEIASVSENLLK